MNNPFAPQAQYYYGSAPQKPIKKYLMIGGLILVVGIVIAVIASIVSSVASSDPDEDSVIADLVDPSEMDEALNENLAKRIQNNPHRDYISSSNETKYFDIADDYFPINLEAGMNEENLIYSAAFSILVGKYVSPVTLENSTIADKAMDSGITIEEVDAVNANALDYYLDDFSVVIIKGKGEAPFSERGKMVLIYAGSPGLGIYQYYTTEGLCGECSLPLVVNRIDLFKSLKSDEKFYILKKEVE